MKRRAGSFTYINADFYTSKSVDTELSSSISANIGLIAIAVGVFIIIAVIVLSRCAQLTEFVFFLGQLPSSHWQEVQLMLCVRDNVHMFIVCCLCIHYMCHHTNQRAPSLPEQMGRSGNLLLTDGPERINVIT